MLRVTPIGNGNAGIYQTIAMMRSMLRRPSPRADDVAFGIKSQHPGATPWVLAAAVHTWVVSHMGYVEDYHELEGVGIDEALIEPELLLARVENHGKGLGDCDDFSILTGALLFRMHVPFDFVVASTRADKIYNHVFIQAHTDRGVIPMDGILGEAYGWSAHDFTAAQAITG